MTFEDRLNSPAPPEALDGVDVEFLQLTLGSFTGPRDHRPPMQFTWHGRSDGRTLEYFRWVDADGARYYQWPEFSRRSGESP